MRPKANSWFVILLLALSASNPVCAAEYEFCVFSDVRDAHVRVKADDDASRPDVIKEVERFFCNRVFGLVCAAVDFSSNTCGRMTEPPRVCRRPFVLSYAAMAGCSSMA